MDELDLQQLVGRTFVQQIRALVETESTNSVALAWSSQLHPRELPALVATEQQTAGRGRGANRWWSAPGALTFSLLIEPAALGLTPDRWPALSLSVGLAIALTVESQLRTADVRLKWPNDVYLNGRKVAGILIESPAAASNRLVIGIGLNVNNSLTHAPDDVRHRAVAMTDVAGSILDRTDLLRRLLVEIEQLLTELAVDSPGLATEWRRHCLLTGRSVVIADSTRTIAGTCLGLDDDGALRVQTGHSVERLFSGVVMDFGG
ncbi:MAG: biotin--[acetyl-CoA-carboxylase] ligase [Planctomycetaceae bacterium]